MIFIYFLQYTPTFKTLKKLKVVNGVIGTQEVVKSQLKGVNRVCLWQYVVCPVTHPCEVQQGQSCKDLKRFKERAVKTERPVIFCLEVCFYAAIPSHNLIV